MYFLGYCTLFFNKDGKVLGEVRKGPPGNPRKEIHVENQLASGCGILMAIFPKDSHPPTRRLGRAQISLKKIWKGIGVKPVFYDPNHSILKLAALLEPRFRWV